MNLKKTNEHLQKNIPKIINCKKKPNIIIKLKAFNKINSITIIIANNYITQTLQLSQADTLTRTNHQT